MVEGVSRLGRDSVDSVDFGASRRADSVGFGASIRSRPVGFGASRRADWVVSRRDSACRSCRFRRVVPIRSVSARRVVPIRSVSARRDSACRACLPTPKSRRKHKKKPDSSIVESGCSYRKASRALNLPLAPLSNTRASARSVLRGLARRSCNVMITSDLRHIVHYTLQNMRTREQS